MMDPTTQIALVKRVHAHLAARTTDHDDAPTTRDVAAYVDAKRYEREIERVFRGRPLAIGHASKVAVPGEYFTHDASGLPLLVVRGEDGVLRAFKNVCRHRGTRLEAASCGRKKAFSCPYHAWSYRSDGSVLAIPHEHGFVGIDKEERALAQVDIAEAAGLLWLVPKGQDAKSFLGDTIVRDLDGFGIATGHSYAPHTTTKEMNWKLTIDVFLEAYHLKPTHRESIYPIFFDNLGLVDRFGPHLRNVFPKRTIRELASRPEAEWVLRTHANVLFHLFPNTFILIEPDHAAVLHLWPLGPTKTRLDAYMVVPEAPTTEKARTYWDANDAILRGAVEEDFTMGESIQRGLASGANREVVFGSFEHALAHFHREVDRATGQTPDHGGTIT